MTSKTHKFNNAMRLYSTELICGTCFAYIIREVTKRGRRRLRGLRLKIQVRVIHITTKLFHVVSRLKCAVTVED